MLTKNDILKINDLPTRKISVPEWGGHVNVRGLNGTERDDYEQRVLDRNKGDKVALKAWRARIVASTIVDDKGENIFTDSDIAALAKKSAAALDRIVDVVLELSGFAAKADEDAEGN